MSRGWVAGTGALREVPEIKLCQTGASPKAAPASATQFEKGIGPVQDDRACLAAFHYDSDSGSASPKSLEVEKMPRLAVLSASLILMLQASFALAADKQPIKEESDSAQRKDVMRRRVMSLTLESQTDNGQVNVPVIETPLLRYSNPASDIITPDATVWAWGKAGRPSAIASVEPAGLEVVSLSDLPLTMSGKSGTKWTASTSELKWSEVPDSPEAGATSASRSRQMKEISRRFTATGTYHGGGAVQLRLMDRQLLRYTDEDKRLIDGAIFAFAAGTNPEVLLLVEARQPEGQPAKWSYAFARLSAGLLEARLGEAVVWSCPSITSWSSTAPYTSAAFDKEDIDDDGPRR